MKKIILLITFVILWAAWYLCYPHYLVWLEGYGFFSTLPDFTDIYMDFPRDVPRYVGAFLLQFYAVPGVGPAVQALLPLLSVLCLYMIVRRLFKDSDGLLWIPFVALPIYVFNQMDDMTLTRSVTILSCAVAGMLAAMLCTLKARPFAGMPEFLRNRYLALSVIIASVCISTVIIVKKSPLNGQYEDIAHLECLAENKDWDKILEMVSVQESVKDEFKRKYVLLALSQTGMLPDYAFRYGLSSPDDFVYTNAEDPFKLNFNILFYRSLGMNNPAVHQAYQQAVQSLPGATFHSLRTLADIYLENKDYVMAKKYLDILDHSTCHGKWVRERRPLLEAIKDAIPEYKEKDDDFILDSFFRDISSMLDRNIGDTRYADLIMCGVLSRKDGNTFFQVFNAVAPSLYSTGRKIPDLYQEALLLIAGKEPEVMQMYRIDEDVCERFEDFTDLIRAGKVVQAKRKYSGTYWAYVY